MWVLGAQTWIPWKSSNILTWWAVFPEPGNLNSYQQFSTSVYFPTYLSAENAITIYCSQLGKGTHSPALLFTLDFPVDKIALASQEYFHLCVWSIFPVSSLLSGLIYDCFTWAKLQIYSRNFCVRLLIPPDGFTDSF